MEKRNKVHLVLCSLLLIWNFYSCRYFNEKTDRKHFYANDGNIIGDSLILKGLLLKIIFTDTILGIDSIVYTHYPNGNLNIVSTYKLGKPILERLTYFANGKLKKYEFIDANSKYSYERNYDENGNLATIIGKPFFVCLLDNIDASTLELKKDTPLNAFVYIPIPPKVETKIYTKFNETDIEENFEKRSYLPYLYRATFQSKNLGNYRWDMIMRFYDKSRDTLIETSGTLFIKVVK